MTDQLTPDAAMNVALVGVDPDAALASESLAADLGVPGTATHFEPIAYGNDATVVAVYEPDVSGDQGFESEAALEAAFIKQLVAQAYERVHITTAKDLETNLRQQLEALNEKALRGSDGTGSPVFTDGEWDSFFSEKIANRNDDIVKKTSGFRRTTSRP